MVKARQLMARTQKAETEGKSGLTQISSLGLLSQGKKISQIISYIWLNEDAETAHKLDSYFRRGDNETLQKLLCAVDPESPEYKLLLEVFKNDAYLPIFTQADKEIFNFRVTVDEFEGSLDDPGPSDDGIFTLTIPYPPRPQISDEPMEYRGYTTIKKAELKAWLKQSPNEKPFFEDNPYIPTSCS